MEILMFFTTNWAKMAPKWVCIGHFLDQNVDIKHCTQLVGCWLSFYGAKSYFDLKYDKLRLNSLGILLIFKSVSNKI